MHTVPLVFSHTLYSAVFWASFGAFAVLEGWVWGRELGGTKGKDRDRGSRIWVVISMWIGFYLAFSALYWASGATVHSHARAVFATGIAVLWIGLWLRWWSIRTLGHFFRTSVVIQGEHRMITTGPYRKIRNPSYSGAMLIVAGIGLALDNWVSLAFVVVFSLIAYARRIQVEQEALVEHFGQPYRDYIARTWALIPFVW
jgi:protein-S-isoprenylcysteine O-methyltransferase